MSEAPLVSVIIPTYNRAHLIGETLDSVLAQTYQNWECIIVDDGSSDNTDYVIKGYVKKDSRFKYFHRPDEHLPGGNGARNYGIIKSGGDFINFLDSDDYLAEFTLEDKVSFLNDETDVIISMHTNLKQDLKRAQYIIDRIDGEKYDENFILSRPNILIGDPLISNSYLDNLLFSETQLRVQDHVFFIDLFSKPGNFLKIDGVHYLYNPTENSITKKASSGDKLIFNQQIDTVKHMIKKYKHHPKIVEGYKRKSRQGYKALVKKHKFSRIFNNFNHFKNSFNLTSLEFTLWFVYNTITKKGFDKMKHKIK